MNPSDWLLRALQRPRASILVCLLLLCVLAWVYLLVGAGMDMRRMDMGPIEMGPMDMGTMAVPNPPFPSTTSFALILAMWWIMMIAMMLPSATPAILLYAKVREHALARGAPPVPAGPGLFAGGYLLVWLAFSLAAASLQLALASQRILSSMRMALDSSALAGLLLMAAGIYQLSPLKTVCLMHCRSPADYFARHWRPGPSGALRLGILHGAYCLGCCWALMLILFAGGIMNILWIVALTLVVMAEKLMPWGDAVSKFVGTGLIGAGIVYLVG